MKPIPGLIRPIFQSAIILGCILGCARWSSAQGLNVPVYSEGPEAENQLRDAAVKLRKDGKLMGDSVLTNQFSRKFCQLTLPKPATNQLSSRDLWAIAHTAHLRVGWYYLCTKCNKWHLNLAAGYALTKDGAVATCYHVVAPPDSLKEGFLVVADENGEMFPVTEILAANQALDVCILRVAAKNLKPLPLNTEIFPGDRCVCFSDPLGERGYYSEGIVSRFLTTRAGRRRNRGDSPSEAATRLDVTTDWAPGSSGAAVLDNCGNAIGHVTSIATLGDRPVRENGRRQAGPTLITIHEAVSARDVLGLIRPPLKTATDTTQ